MVKSIYHLRFLPSFLFSLILPLFVACSASQQEEAPVQERPNVVFILTDDQGYCDLRIHGNPWVDTPAIDSLALSGTWLDRFFVSPL